MAATRSSALALYKRLLREGQKFTGYNYRMYAIRRIRDAFRESRSETDASKVQDLFAKGEQACEVLRRQVVISQLYREPILVIEAANRNQSP